MVDNHHKNNRFSRLNPNKTSSFTLEDLLNQLKISLDTISPTPSHYILLEANFVNLHMPSIQLNFYHIKNSLIALSKTIKLVPTTAKSYMAKVKSITHSPYFDIPLESLPPQIVSIIELFGSFDQITVTKNRTLHVTFSRITCRSSFSIRACFMIYLSDKSSDCSFSESFSDLLHFSNS